MLYKNHSKCLSAKPDFIYDEACLDIISDKPVEIYEQYEDCVKCPFELSRAIDSLHKSASVLINTKYKLNLEARFPNEICNQTLRFDEHARYVWNITNGNCTQIYVKEAADNAYLPILGAIIFILCFGTLWYMVKCIYKCTRNQRYFVRYFETNPSDDSGNPLEAPLVIEQVPSRVKYPFRVKSIDVFRGFCIVLMIFVNYGGGKYWFFNHSIWNGLTVADLVFPWFVWLMGMSLRISMRSRLRSLIPRRQIALQVFYRAIILILLGFILNSHGRKSDLDDLRFPGVLQRLGIVYLSVGLLEIFFAERIDGTNNRLFGWAGDIIEALPQWLVVITLVIVHTCFTFLLPVAGCPRGYLGPGGLNDDKKFENCTGGAAGYLDRIIFRGHMYKTPTCHFMYNTTLPYDPEGLLGTLTTLLTAYFGVQAARILQKHPTLFGKVFRWFTWAFVTGLMAGILCNFSKNNGVIPINKNLWSLSYALALSSMAFFIEAILYILVDVTRKWGGRPFFYAGMNSILLYVGHVVMKNTFPFVWVPSYKNHREYLAMNLWATFLWVTISIFLYKKNIFFKI